MTTTELANIETIKKEVSTPLVIDVERVAKLSSKSVSTNTTRAYASDWAGFEVFCRERNLTSLPALSITVVAYLDALMQEGKKASTITRVVSAIKHYHEVNNYDDCTDDAVVRNAKRNVNRSLGTAKAKKQACTLDILKICLPLGKTLIDYRDKALLLLGFATGLRRSELVALNVEDMEFSEKGLKVTVRRSKSDQSGQGRLIGVPTTHTTVCAVTAVKQWVKEANIATGALWLGVDRHGNKLGRLSDKGVSRIVKSRVEDRGFDASAFGGHSLRAGVVTTLAQVGLSADAIGRHTGQSINIVGEYVRTANILDDSNVLRRIL